MITVVFIYEVFLASVSRYSSVFRSRVYRMHPEAGIACIESMTTMTTTTTRRRRWWWWWRRRRRRRRRFPSLAIAETMPEELAYFYQECASSSEVAQEKELGGEKKERKRGEERSLTRCWKQASDKIKLPQSSLIRDSKNDFYFHLFSFFFSKSCL